MTGMKVLPGRRRRGEEVRSRTAEIDCTFIRRRWRDLNIAESFKPIMDGEVSLNRHKMECLKDSYKSSIWKLEIRSGGKKLPVILKIWKPLRKKRPESTVEKYMYRKAKKLLQPFMPQIYAIKRHVNGRDLWVFMEYVEPIKGQVQYNPDYFDRIIPTLAKLHASTMDGKFMRHARTFAGWLPRFDSEEMVAERIRINRLTRQHLEEAMKLPDYRPIIKPYYKLLKELLAKGPEYFPEVSKTGLSIVHSDLHTANMACGNVKEAVWSVKFIDWEGAKFAPCWYDLVYLVGVFLAYRREWKDEEEAITRRCVNLYADEMRKNGVEFAVDPMELYRMAYLKRILERGLYLQLNWAVTGKKEPKLLPVYLEKIKTWSKKLGL